MPKNRNQGSGVKGQGSGSTAHARVDDVAGQDAQVRGVQGRPRHGRHGGSFAARFGRLILQHGIAAIPSALYHYQGEMLLSAQQVWLVSYILSHKWDEDLPYPSLKKMARCTTLSLSQLQRIKNSLCDMGYLKVYPRFDEKQGQNTNAYDFSGLFDRLEELITGDAPAANEIRAESEAPDLGELSEVDPSFVARYGRVITRRGVAAVPRAVFTHQAALGLTPQQVWFITYIFSFQWDTALPYPSIRRMSTLTGYSSVQLHNIKSELVRAGYLRLVHRRDEQGGQDTNAYDFSGLLDAIRAHLQPDIPKAEPRQEIVTQSDAESTPSMPIARRRGKRGIESGRTGLPKGDSAQLARGDRAELARRNRKQLPEGGSKAFTGGDVVQFTGGGSNKLPGRGRKELSGRDSEELPDGDSAQLSFLDNHAPAGGTSHAYSRGVARALHEEETEQVETIQKDDSNHLPQKKSPVTKESDNTPPPYSPYIAAVITDFSTELNDPAHTISNVAQALRLWQTSGLNEQQFTELLYEAKRLTRSYQGKQGLGTINNKMAYFFAIIRDLCKEQS
ncbi:MAG TPA: hypothetical protein VEX13_03180 [Chloroflexia bacterium]|nr:hypothetical protein [Chloroflexia bacterium]